MKCRFSRFVDNRFHMCTWNRRYKKFIIVSFTWVSMATFSYAIYTFLETKKKFKRKSFSIIHFDRPISFFYLFPPFQLSSVSAVAHFNRMKNVHNILINQCVMFTFMFLSHSLPPAHSLSTHSNFQMEKLVPKPKRRLFHLLLSGFFAVMKSIQLNRDGKKKNYDATDMSKDDDRWKYGRRWQPNVEPKTNDVDDSFRLHFFLNKILMHWLWIRIWKKWLKIIRFSFFCLNEFRQPFRFLFIRFFVDFFSSTNFICDFWRQRDQTLFLFWIIFSGRVWILQTENDSIGHFCSQWKKFHALAACDASPKCSKTNKIDNRIFKFVFLVDFCSVDLESIETTS